MGENIELQRHRGFYPERVLDFRQLTTTSMPLSERQQRQRVEAHQAQQRAEADTRRAELARRTSPDPLAIHEDRALQGNVFNTEQLRQQLNNGLRIESYQWEVPGGRSQEYSLGADPAIDSTSGITRFHTDGGGNGYHVRVGEHSFMTGEGGIRELNEAISRRGYEMLDNNADEDNPNRDSVRGWEVNAGDALDFDLGVNAAEEREEAPHIALGGGILANFRNATVRTASEELRNGVENIPDREAPTQGGMRQQINPLQLHRYRRLDEESGREVRHLSQSQELADIYSHYFQHTTAKSILDMLDPSTASAFKKPADLTQQVAQQQLEEEEAAKWAAESPWG